MGGIKVPATGEDPANMAKLLMQRASILTTTLRNRSDDYKSALLDDMYALCAPLFADKTLVPVIDKTFPLSQAYKAHEYIESNRSVGKVILVNDLF
jgi:NADPH:quinone reductase-like Zn-dependent oxidoreductase